MSVFVGCATDFQKKKNGSILIGRIFRKHRIIPKTFIPHISVLRPRIIHIFITRYYVSIWVRYIYLSMHNIVDTPPNKLRNKVL